MSIVSFTPLADATTAVAAGVNTPLTTLYNDHNGNIDNSNIAAGAAIAGSKLAAGSVTNTQMATAASPVTRGNETGFDFVASGCVWTADAAASTRLATMSSGVAYIAGVRLTVAAVTSRTFTASKDVYVGLIDAGDGTATVVYYDNTTNTASPSLVTAAYTMLIGIIVVGATNIATTASINQGQENRVLPIASSVPYAVTDSLGNLICPRDPNRKTLGYRQITSTITTTSTTAVLITGLSVPVIIPTGRKIVITVHSAHVFAGTASKQATTSVYSGATSGTLTNLVNGINSWTASANFTAGVLLQTQPLTTSGTVFFSAALTSDTGGAVTTSFVASANFPAYIKVELE